ncbi:MAG: zinc-ribbon domain-containing protein, partial [Polyangiaceae bacterium]|nr:zinc-ribbon domain-containing protein [Polyangiaceae bacterium]
MDVRCGQCGTDYDFDDALLSSRGTMVRCTTCGHQFKVFPAHAVGGVADRWLIEKTSGQQLVFTSLKDLQRAIGAGVVRRQDVLTHGGEVRQVGSIAELDSLFRRRQAPAHDPRTLMGIAPSRAGSAGLPPTTEPTAAVKARPHAQEQSDSNEDDVTEVVRSAPEPPVPTPHVGVEIPALARATPSELDKNDVTERPEASPGATAPTDSPSVLVEASAAETLATPRSPTGPEQPPVPTAESEAGRAGERPKLAEAPHPVGYGRYAETLRSEEALLPTVSSAGPEHGSATPANGSAPGAKPIARIATQRVAVRRVRPGASTMRSSDWADGSEGFPAGRAPDVDGQTANAKGEASESSPLDSTEPAAPQKVGAIAEEPQSAAAEPQKADAIAEELQKVAVEPPQAEPQKVAVEPPQVSSVDEEPQRPQKADVIA